MHAISLYFSTNRNKIPSGALTTKWISVSSSLTRTVIVKYEEDRQLHTGTTRLIS